MQRQRTRDRDGKRGSKREKGGAEGVKSKCLPKGRGTVCGCAITINNFFSSKKPTAATMAGLAGDFPRLCRVKGCVRGLVSISFRYISLSLCVSDNKIKLKYGWQLVERNEWKLLNRLRYDSMTKQREGEEDKKRDRVRKRERELAALCHELQCVAVGNFCLPHVVNCRVMNAPISRQWIFV